MKLLSLQLKNFRQFYGDTPEIKFAANPGRNVTVIHGANGAGKTALLNAFSWALFDVFSPAFLYPEQLVNKRALREASPGDAIEASVNLRFEHDDRKYELKRWVKERYVDGEIKRVSEDATLQYDDGTGAWRPASDVSDVIGRILPVDLHTYFFFDGERIERIVQPGRKERDEIARATKRLLGVEVLERAERHLATVRRDFEAELERVGDPETRRLLKEKAEWGRAVLERDQQKSDAEREVAALEEQEEEISARLRSLDEVRSLQERRDQLKHDLKLRKDSLTQSRKALQERLSQSAYTAFLSGISARFAEFSNELRKRGELPAGIKRQFVQDLLDKEACICGMPLAADSSHRALVQAWMERAGLADVEEKLIRMGGAVQEIMGRAPTLSTDIDRLQKEKSTDRQEISRIETELESISDRLRGSPREEISGLEARLTAVREQIKHSQREIGRLTGEIARLREDISRLDQEIQRHKTFEAKQTLALRRIEACGDAGSRIAAIRERLEARFRAELEQKVRELFDEMSPTPYVPSLGDDYSLRLLDSAGGAPLPVASSTGESQILSLAFIGSIIEVTREFQSRKTNISAPAGGGYPIVMDSPFGSLDPNYRHQVAEHIPKLADQVVVMVSQTQWRGEVENSLSGKSPRHYVLSYNTPKEDVKEAKVEIGGKEFWAIRKSPNSYEYTEIVEVTGG